MMRGCAERRGKLRHPAPERYDVQMLAGLFDPNARYLRSCLASLHRRIDDGEPVRRPPVARHHRERGPDRPVARLSGLGADPRELLRRLGQIAPPRRERDHTRGDERSSESRLQLREGRGGRIEVAVLQMQVEEEHPRSVIAGIMAVRESELAAGPRRIGPHHQLGDRATAESAAGIDLHQPLRDRQRSLGVAALLIPFDQTAEAPAVVALGFDERLHAPDGLGELALLRGDADGAPAQRDWHGVPEHRGPARRQRLVRPPRPREQLRAQVVHGDRARRCLARARQRLEPVVERAVGKRLRQRHPGVRVVRPLRHDLARELQGAIGAPPDQPQPSGAVLRLEPQRALEARDRAIPVAKPLERFSESAVQACVQGGCGDGALEHFLDLGQLSGALVRSRE